MMEVVGYKLVLSTVIINLSNIVILFGELIITTPGWGHLVLLRTTVPCIVVDSRALLNL